MTCREPRASACGYRLFGAWNFAAIQHPASNIEPHLVKSLHPIAEIAARISRADGNGVRLTRASSAASADVDDTSPAANGEASHVDPAAAVVRALAEPVEFPPLAVGIVPGDRFAVAVDSDVPCVGSIVRGAVEALQIAGVGPQDISIVTCDAQTGQICREELSKLEPGPQFVVHDPDDELNLCVIGMTKRGAPVLVNRTIFEADVVLPDRKSVV